MFLGTRTKPYRFVWRNVSAERWYTVSLQAADIADAVKQMHAHLTVKLGKKLDTVVLDHFFYLGENPPPVEPGQSGDAPHEYVSEPLSLRGCAHPFFIEFDNRVYAPAQG